MESPEARLGAPHFKSLSFAKIFVSITLFAEMKRLSQLLHHRSLTVSVIALVLAFYAVAFLPEVARERLQVERELLAAQKETNELLKQMIANQKP
jgi:hypothetical protein